MLDLLSGFIVELRNAGLPVSLTENLDAMEAIMHIPLEDREAFKYALGATLVKNHSHWRSFETVFEVYFSLRGPEYNIAEGADGNADMDEFMRQMQQLQGQGEGKGGGSMDGLTPEELMQILMNALMNGDQAMMRALAKQAVQRFAGMEPGRPVGGTYYLYRTLRNLDLDNVLEKLMDAQKQGAESHNAEFTDLEERLERDEFNSRIDAFKKEIEAEIRRRLVADIKTLTDKPVTLIINTHTHGDHVSGNVEFPATVDEVSHENTKVNMAAMRPSSFVAQPPGGAPANIFTEHKGVGMAKRTFKDQMTIGTGAERIELHYFGRAHTNGDAMVLFPAARVLHMADVFPTKGLPGMDANNGGSGVEYAQTLTRAADFADKNNVAKIVNGHNEATTTRAELREYISYVKEFVQTVQDGKLVQTDVPMRNAMNEVLRDWYVDDCQGGVGRWNKIIEDHGIADRLRLPDRKFNRGIGQFAGFHFTPDGRHISDEEWARRKHEWLPTPEDKKYLLSIMNAPIYEPGKFANYIAPPTRGIKGVPIDFEYVRTEM